MEKREFRKFQSEKLLSVSKEEILSGNKKIEESFFSLDFSGIKSAFVYVSADREPETRGIIRRLLEKGISVSVPKCFGNGEMEALRIKSLEELSIGMYGLMEPQDSAPGVEAEKLSLIVVPGIAFDVSGYRLGRGAGYYDRFLKKAKTALKVGLCRDINLEERVPTDENDVPVDIIITESKIIK